MAEDKGPSDDELGERLRKLLGEPGDGDRLTPPSDETVPDPVNAKLSEIEEKTREIRERHRLPDPPEWNYKRSTRPIGKQTDIDYRGVGLGFSVLYALIGPLLVGFGIGWFIDSRTGGSGARVWGAMIGSVCGLIGAVVLMSQTSRTGPKK
jgi:F0F1-type ATP synthase assembly protein I